MATSHSGGDSLNEALNLIVRSVKSDVTEVSPQEILKVDNELRAKWGMRPLSAYPVFEREYRPSEKKAYFQRLVKAVIVREKGKLPLIQPVYEDCEGYDPIDNPDITKEKVNSLLAKLYPAGGTITPEMRKAALESVVQMEQLERSGEVLDSTPPAEEDDDSASKGKAAAGGKKGK